MHRRSFLLGGFAFLVYAAGPMQGQPGNLELKPGDTLPPLAGQSLTGKWVDIASVLGSKPAVLVFSFSRSGGQDAQLWTQRLQKGDPHLAIYTVIFLESVPGLFRSMAVSGIKNGMPAALQDRTILLYRDEATWKNRLQVVDEHQAFVMSLGSAGRVRGLTSGPFTEQRYSELSTTIQTSD